MDSTLRIAQKMAALADLGFQRVESAALPTESVPVGGGRSKITCSEPSMGTLVSVTAIHESRDLVQDAAGRAFQEMGRVVDLLNRYDPSSALSFLNAEGTIQGPPPELMGVMSEALRFHLLSGGSFDPTVQPLVDLLRRRALDAGSRTPSDDLGQLEKELLEALALVDGNKVVVEGRSIRLSLPGMGITLDGIAKGFVVDRMVAVLRDHGLSDFLINAGGDVRSAGTRENGEPWRVGVQDPQKRGELPDVIGLSDGAVATSGSYEIYFDPDRTHHHIVSPRTGASPQTHQSVSVVAPTTMAADALATSVFVMEPERGVAFIESIPQCACLIVDRNGRQLRSRGWRSATDPPTSRQG